MKLFLPVTKYDANLYKIREIISQTIPFAIDCNSSAKGNGILLLNMLVGGY